MVAYFTKFQISYFQKVKIYFEDQLIESYAIFITVGELRLLPKSFEISMEENAIDLSLYILHSLQSFRISQNME